MGYVVKPEGFAGQTIEVEPTSFVRGPRLLVNGEPAPKGSRRGEMLLTRDDGRKVVATWKPRALGFDVPNLVIDGKPVDVVEPLAWYVWAWCAIPVLMVVVGGGLGALVGMLSFWTSARLFRSKLSTALKFVATGGITVLAVLAYTLLAALFLRAIG